MLLRPGHQFAAERVQGCYDSRGKGAHRDLPSRAPAALTAGALYTAALLVLPHRPGWGQIPVQKLATPSSGTVLTVHARCVTLPRWPLRPPSSVQRWVGIELGVDEYPLARVSAED